MMLYRGHLLAVFSMQDMRIVFMGTPDFAVPSLRRLAGEGYVPIAVATGPDKPRGRGRRMLPTPVKQEAERLGVRPILQPASLRDPAFADAVGRLTPDLIVVVAFRILPPEVFGIARAGAFNLHGSLLPKYRGAAPIHRAVMAGETKTGVSTFFLKEAVDTGNVILQETMPIGPDETAGDVHDRMMALGAEAVVETVRRIQCGQAQGRPQNDEEATPAPRIRKEDTRIAWRRPAYDVHNQIRGLSPRPGAWTRDGESTIKIYRTRLADAGRACGAPGRPGQVLQASDRLVVACGEGAVEALELQAEGRRRLPAMDFLRGQALPAGHFFK